MATRSTSGKSNGALDPALPQKKRARRRLVGAAAICLAAAIVLPIVLDSEPRQIRDDVQVRIPSRDTPLSERIEAPPRSGVVTSTGPSPSVRPGETGDPAGSNARVGAGTGGARGADEKPEPGGAAAREPVTSDVTAADAKASASAAKSAKPEAGPGERAEARPEPKAEPKAEARAESKRDPIAKLVESKEQTAAKSENYLVQIGAFSTEKGASEQIDRARKAGFKAYTEKLKTSQGERIRVRIGPFASRDAADQARTRLRAAGVESVLIAP